MTTNQKASAKEWGRHALASCALALAGVGLIGTSQAQDWTPSPEEINAFWPSTPNALWLDAADASTITADGSNDVSEWRDKSGEDRHATQTGPAGDQPNTGGTHNGLNVITLDGTGFFDLGTGLDWMAPGVAHTAFIMIKVNSGNNIYGAANGGSGANSLHVGFNGANYRMNYWGNDYGPAPINLVAGEFNFLRYNWVEGGAKSIYANASLEGMSAATHAGNIQTMAGGGRIGNVVGQGRINADIAEIILIDGDPDAELTARIEGYLAWKWGEQAKLPAGHPYESAPPQSELNEEDPPVITVTVPADDDGAALLGDLVATFNESLQIGSGNIRIVNDSDNVTTTIPVTDATQVTVSGRRITISPDVALIGGKDYHVELDAGLVEDMRGNAFLGVLDSTTWNFTTDGIPPVLDSFADNKPGGQVFENASVTYTVTFNEGMNASTIEVGDFSNSGTATITVDSVTAVSDRVYEVVVTATSTGTLQLQVSASANLEDLAGNALDTSSPIPDDSVINVVPFAANNASLGVDFQATIASEQHPTYAGEARYYHVSVNPANPGTGSYAATIVGTNEPAPRFVRNYDGEVVSYKFLGGTNNDISGIAAEGGETARITYATEDTIFDGFGQQQAKIWVTTDPGADLATGGADPSGVNTNDANGGGYRSFGGAVGTIDISGLSAGSLHIYYGSFNAKPAVSVTMRDSSGLQPDVTLTNVHLNDDSADRTEYYLAEIDFVTDGVYDQIVYTWLANGVDYSGNGRGLGTVLTGPPVPGDYSTWAEQFAPADLSDPEADLDGDGLSNDTERLFGLDPTDPASQNPITVGLVPGGDSFSFTRRDPTLTGKYTGIETSVDLRMWTRDDGAMLEVTETDENGVETIAVMLSAGLLTGDKLFVRVVQDDGVLVSENFESGDGGFTAMTTAGSDWQYGTPDSSGYLDQTVTEGNGGSANCWGVHLGTYDGGNGPNGYYVNPTTDARLRSAVIDLTNVTSAELTFAEALDLQAEDSAAVNVLPESGDTPLNGAPLYTASDSDDTVADWNSVAPIDLTPYAGQKIRIEWIFSGGTNGYLGWYIDDVSVRRTD